MKIFISQISQQTTEEELRKAFEDYGLVESVKLIKDKYTGESRGFGYVWMPNDTQGKAAIKGLNRKKINGQKLKINEARTRLKDRKAPERRLRKKKLMTLY
jgi:RNA recognition motif-containing protein